LYKIIFITFTIYLFSLTISCSHKEESGSGRVYEITVIPKGTTLMFWQSVHAGALKASQELGVQINWIGTEKEDDRQQQIALVDNQIMNQVDGIVLAPLDAMALRRPVQQAVEKGIPVVIIDSDLNDVEGIITSFVATDNVEGGRLAARNLASLLDNIGKVVMLRFLEGSGSTNNREQGFLEEIQNYPGIQVVSDEQYAGPTKSTAQQASENLLLRFKNQGGDLTIQGIFCPNESSAYGMLQALRRQRLTGQVQFVGFDATAPLVEGLESGDIEGLVVQDPFKMGYLGVKTLVQKLNGEPVVERIDTGVVFVKKEDLSKPEIKELINPDLKKWQQK
jgi:ribose transport system substrate-binding protein